MKLNYTLRVFLIVALVSAVALVVYLANVNTTGHLVTQAPLITVEELYNSVGLRNVNVGEFIGQEYQALTGQYLMALSTDTITTDRGRTDTHHSLVLFQSGVFNGGQVVYEQNEQGETGDFLKFMSGLPLFLYRVEFDSGLNSDIEGRDAEDLEGKLLKLLGASYFVLEARVSGNRVELKLAGPAGIVKLTDDLDTAFSRGVEINGKNMDAQVRIRGTSTSDFLSIISIEYMPNADAPLGGNVYVEPKTFLSMFLEYPAVMLNPQFDIGYGGLRGGGGTQTVARRTSYSGSGLFELKGSRKEYNLYLGSQRVPFVALQGGAVKFGSTDRDLIFSESTAIGEDDMFVANPTGSDGPNDRSYWYSIERIDTAAQRVYYKDLQGGGTKEAPYNAAGKGTMNIGGINLDFEVTGTTVKIDLNGDGGIGGDTTVWIISPAVYIDPSGGGGSVDLDVVFRGRFKETGGDETTTVKIFKDGSELDLMLTNLDTEDVSGHIEQGLTQAGLLFTIDESDRPPHLIVGGSVGGTVRTTSSPGQAQAIIVITFEKSSLVRRSS